MTSPDHILSALLTVARAATPRETMAAMNVAHRTLGSDVDTYRPLLETLAVRSTELEQLRRLAGTDALTGIANRRAFMDALDRAVARHNRTRDGLAVILLDLDGLKELNDVHGHAAGDEAIAATARACQATLRDTDLVARLGGDEFAVLLPDADPDAVATVAARLRAAVEACTVADSPLRISVGTTAAGTPPATADGMLAIADADLYQDKRGRKDRATRRAA